MAFPETRMRRMRRTASLRALVREHQLRASQLVLPIFVKHGGAIEPIDGLPGHDRMSIDAAVEVAQRAQDIGIGGVLLFGIPSGKDENGSEAWDDEGIVQLGIRAIRAAVPDLTVMTDVCLCQYTTSGHCGIVRHGEVQNDETLDLLQDVAVSHARAGAQVVAPSDMMDGRVGAIRAALDAEHFEDTALMAYSAKFASAFYGPFRNAAGSTPQEGDRSGYQMDPANGNEAVREAFLDVDEGADVIMVKPAMTYLDLIYRVKTETELPVAAYHTSGEYASVKAAAERGWLNGEQAMMESLTSIVRAGADIVITYASLEAAELLAAGAAKNAGVSR